MTSPLHKAFAPAAAIGGSPGYVVVEGPIGVGKTSLAQRLAETYAAELLLEQPEENPFLERFYRERRRFALPTQLYFCSSVPADQDWKQRDLFQLRAWRTFCWKDSLFARINLDDDESDHNRCTPSQPRSGCAGLVIYLQARPRCCSAHAGVACRTNGDRAATWKSWSGLHPVLHHYTVACCWW